MEVRFGARRGPAPLAPVPRCHVGFHADDRFDTGLLGLLLEIPGCVQVPVVSDREGGLLQLLRTPNQVVYPVGSVQQGVFRVTVEMNEGHETQDTSRARPTGDKNRPLFVLRQRASYVVRQLKSRVLTPRVLQWTLCVLSVLLLAAGVFLSVSESGRYLARAGWEE